MAGHPRSNGRTFGRRGGGGAWARRLPVILLLLALGVAGFGAFEAYRSQRTHAAATAALLADYGGFAAFTYKQRAFKLMADALEGPLAVRRGSMGSATVSRRFLEALVDRSRTVNSCGCGMAIGGRYAFSFRLGQDPTASTWAGQSPDTPERASIEAAVSHNLRTQFDARWPFAIVFGGEGAGGAVVAYAPIDSRRRPAAAARDTTVVGFQIDRDRLNLLLALAMEGEILLPPSLTRDRPNQDMVAVEVRGPDQAVLFASHAASAFPFAHDTPRSPMLGGGVIRASVLPEVADNLVIGGLPADRTPMYLALLALAGTLAVLALGQLRREDRLALLRQDFVASVSHELRTPLSQVRLFTETLRLGRTRNGSEREWALENIDRETHRLANLVENILCFSRSERGVLRIDPEPGDLAETAREAIESFRRLLPSGKAEIVAEFSERLPTELDGDAIRQVVLNLLENAVRYGPAGQKIRVTGSRSAVAVEIAVRDQGPGVPRSDRERIFEPFRRGEHTIGTVAVGSGIGLSVVREIVEAHGGRTWVEEPPEGGARFVVRLPIARTARGEHFVSGPDTESRRPGVA